MATVALSAAAVAQTPKTGGEPMTLTGCLVSTPNPDPAGAVGKPPIYTMEVVPPATGPAPTTSTTSSSPGASGRSSSTTAVKPTVYTLTATESVDLAKHVNHRIEVTGQLEYGQSGAMTRQPSTSSATPVEQESKAGGAHNTFKVASLKMVAADCKTSPGQ